MTDRLDDFQRDVWSGEDVAVSYPEGSPQSLPSRSVDEYWQRFATSKCFRNRLIRPVRAVCIRFEQDLRAPLI